jgi:N-acylneuraminate cytidylyltransferase
MNVCIIPARGGSKRIPRKNIKAFFGKPMIAYSIEAALKSGCFDQVIVSTDDKEIADVAEEYGAEVPFKRPETLADDFTVTLPVIKHALSWLEEQGIKLNFVCCLYATAPFVRVQDITNAYKIINENNVDYCFTCTTYSFPIQRAFKCTNENRVEMLYPEHLNTRSQDLTEVFHDAGQFYWGTVEAFRNQKPFFTQSSIPYVLPRYLVQDIDNLDDWQRAELMFKSLKFSKKTHENYI